MMHRRSTVTGTAGYVAPEIIAGEPYGAPADIWSLGCLLYAMLTVTLPYKNIILPSPHQKTAANNHPQACECSLDLRLIDAAAEGDDTCSDLISQMLKIDPHARPTIK